MRNDSTEAHGVLLAAALPAVAAKFGAMHAHVIAHSKGGLDTRDALARLLQATTPSGLSVLGVLSLTTLSTPHHGSVGADYAIDSIGADAALSTNPGRVSLVQKYALFVPDREARPSLRTDRVAEFNITNILPLQLLVAGDDRPALPVVADRAH